MPRRRRTPEDFAAEVEAHLTLETERLASEGWSPEAARDAAERRFGNATRVREQFYESTRMMWVERLWIDLWGAARSVARYPVAALVAMVSLGGGIGGATVTLALRDTLHYLPPPLYAAPDQLSIVRLDFPDRMGALTPAALFQRWTDGRGGQATLAAASTGRPVDVRLADRLETTMVRSTTANLFSTLGVLPAVGRRFDDAPGGSPATAMVMLSHRQWLDWFGGRADAIGASLWLNDVSHTVVGVLPPHFWFGDLSEPLWTLADQRAYPPEVALHVVVRRGGPDTHAALQQRLQAAAQPYAAAQPAGQRDLRVRVSPMIGTPIGEAMGPNPGLLIGLAVLFTLLIGCTNVAVLLMAQWTARAHELAIRASIGADRHRLVRTLVAEAVVIAAFGGALGVVVTLALRGLAVYDGGEFTALNLSIRPRVFAAAGLVTLAAGLLTGLAPALYEVRRAAGNPLTSLRVSDRERQRWRHALVGFEIATAVGLLVVLSAVVSASRRATLADPGFDVAPLLSLRVQNSAGVDVDLVTAHLASLPGVRRAAASTAVPSGPAARPRQVGIDGHDAAGPGVAGASIAPGFFATLGVAMTAGRDFSASDRGAESRVVVVNRRLATLLWPGQSAVGRVLVVDGRPHDVVGVVADYAPGPLRAPPPMVFDPLGPSAPTDIQFLVRSDGEPARLRDVVRREVNALVPGNVVSRSFALQDVARVSGQEILVTAVPLLPLVAIAMLLAAAGIYGVLAFAVSRRGTELAVRMAIGATRAQVLWEVSWASVRVVAAGLAGGVSATFAITRLAQGRGGIFDSPGWTAFVLPVAIVAIVGATAVWLPARRALRIDPARLLRGTDA
jgi:predicted permease